MSRDAVRDLNVQEGERLRCAASRGRLSGRPRSHRALAASQLRRSCRPCRTPPQVLILDSQLTNAQSPLALMNTDFMNASPELSDVKSGSSATVMWTMRR